MTVRQAFPFRAKGDPWARDFYEVWDELVKYDQAHRALIAKVGTTRFLRHLEHYYPPKSVCPKDYKLEWRRSIWRAAWEAYEETKI